MSITLSLRKKKSKDYRPRLESKFKASLIYIDTVIKKTNKQNQKAEQRNSDDKNLRVTKSGDTVSTLGLV